MKGEILKISDRRSHVCEFEIARKEKIGICGKKAAVLIDGEYFCYGCVADVLMRLPEIPLFDDRGTLISTKRFIEESKT